MAMVTYVLLYILSALVSAIVYYMHRNLTYWKRRGIPCDKPHPVYGNLRGFRKTRNLHDNMFDYYHKYKGCGLPFVGFYFLNKPSAFILDMKLTKQILIKDFSNFADRGMYFNERDDPLSAHLFNIDGIMWKRLRNKLTPAFSSGKMKYMFPTVVRIGDALTAAMGREVLLGNSIVEMKELMACYTVDVIGACVFGIECNSLQNSKPQFVEMGRKAFTTVRYNEFLTALMMAFPKTARFFRLCKNPKDINKFYMNLAKETVALREKENIKRNDFMDNLIDLKNNKKLQLVDGEELTNLTIEELAAQLFVFFLAGFETSSSTLSFSLYELAQNPHVQDKLRTEVNEARDFSYECVKDLPLLDQVISETLRLHSLAPHLDRKALRDYVVPGHPEYVIEAGTSIVIPVCAIHRDPDLYPEPEKFKPERFTPEMVATRESVEWLAFGDGPRNCIGMRFGQMQTHVGLAKLIKNFKFSVCDETEIPLKYDPNSLILGTLGGIHLKVERI